MSISFKERNAVFGFPSERRAYPPSSCVPGNCSNVSARQRYQFAKSHGAAFCHIFFCEKRLLNFDNFPCISLNIAFTISFSLTLLNLCEKIEFRTYKKHVNILQTLNICFLSRISTKLRWS